jgi:hypothetical protein
MNERKSQPGHGFWIISNYSYKEQNQVAHCSACGRPNLMPVGDSCKWCGTRMDQKLLDLSDPTNWKEEN